MKNIFQKLRKYEIQIRKAIKSHMQGDYHSVFKGSGIEFDDVRQYQYGDDIRSIDWRVSAKGIGTYVKTFKEDKEQNVFFLIDVSASQKIGKQGSQKIDVTKELCGVLSLAAIKENSSVGVIGYSDTKELYIRPGKGMSHVHQIISRMYGLEPSSSKTSLKEAIMYTLKMVKRRSVIILISDFIDEGYEHVLKGMAAEHDLIVLHTSDVRETMFPKAGIIPLYDMESKRTVWVNSSSNAFRKKMEKRYDSSQDGLQDLCSRNQVDYLRIDTNTDYIPQLIKLFKVRNKTKKRDK